MPERKRGPARGARRGTLLDSLPRTPIPPRAPVSGGRSGSSGSYPRAPRASDPGDSAADARYRERDEIIETPGRLTLPSMPRAQAMRPPSAQPKPQNKPQKKRAPRREAPPQRQTWERWDDTGDYASASDDEIVYAQAEVAPDAPDAPYDAAFRGYDGAYVESGDADEYRDEYGDEYGERYDDYDEWEMQPRTRARNLARPLSPALPHYNDPDDLAPPLYAPLPQDSAPDLAAYRPVRAPHRVRLDTRALAQTARNPWTITRLVLAVTAMLLA
ncbi:MAG: hypothetical protein ACHQ1E_13055, partial [Ktedonobacterales bacterium]